MTKLTAAQRRLLVDTLNNPFDTQKAARATRQALIAVGLASWVKINEHGMHRFTLTAAGRAAAQAELNPSSEVMMNAFQVLAAYRRIAKAHRTAHWQYGERHAAAAVRLVFADPAGAAENLAAARMSLPYAQAVADEFKRPCRLTVAR